MNRHGWNGRPPRSAVLLVLVVTVGLGVAGVTSVAAPALAATTGTTLPNASPTTTATTVLPIQNRLPAPPVTLPLTTRQASTRLNPVLAKVSIAGFALFFLLVVIQLILTRRGRRGRWTL